MSLVNNEAAWIPSKGARLQVGPSEYSNPGPNDLVVRNHAWAINPIDWKIQAFGVFIESYPSIFGCDIAGEVVAVGHNASWFQVGDRIMAHPLGLQTEQLSEQAFQLYTVVQSRCAVKLPDGMAYEDGVKLPLGLLTASAGLYTSEHLALPYPNHRPLSTKTVLLIWGGSSNVGIAAIQLAAASGIEVVAVASERNWDLLRHAGASSVFDQSSPEVIEDLVAHLQNRNVVGAFDVIGSVEATTGAAQVLAQLGGGKLASVFNRFSGIPACVVAKQVQATNVFLLEPDVGEAIWNSFIPKALANGQIRPLLKTCVAGHGLESLQTGIDMVKSGVSGTKVVVLV